VVSGGVEGHGESSAMPGVLAGKKPGRFRQPVWVATASLDTGIGVGPKVPLPTHHIDPNVDAERTYILNSLGGTHPTFVKNVPPHVGHNASGDSFFTDGQAAVAEL